MIQDALISRSWTKLTCKAPVSKQGPIHPSLNGFAHRSVVLAHVIYLALRLGALAIFAAEEWSRTSRALALQPPTWE
jgi:hypothetical protein